MLPFRRKRSWKRRVSDAARNAPQRGRELRAAASQLDIPWARSKPAGLARESFLRFVLSPIMDIYARRRATGRERLAGLKGPVILVANHGSHMDTPVILSALPRRLRKRTAVAAATRGDETDAMPAKTGPLKRTRSTTFGTAPSGRAVPDVNGR